MKRNRDIKLDHRLIYNLIKPGSRVLDLGCGEGDLLQLLTRDKKVIGQGIELDDRAVRECVKKGINAFHGDIESGLSEYPDSAFDYVILNQSMQEVKRVDALISEALRVGRILVVGFPNFAYWRARYMLFFRGQAPITESLPYSWFNTPNVRFLSVSDFRDFCRAKGLKICNAYYLGENGKVRLFPNLTAQNAIFLIGKNKR